MNPRKILLDQPFVFEEPWISDDGTVLERRSGEHVDDVALIRSAAKEGFVAVVLLDEGYLLSSSLQRAARQERISVVATRDRDPWRAAELVQRYADDVGRLEPGSVRRLLADGLHEPEPTHEG